MAAGQARIMRSRAAPPPGGLEEWSGEGAMTAARPFDSVRLTAPAVSLFDGRTIPAGMVGAVL